MPGGIATTTRVRSEERPGKEEEKQMKRNKGFTLIELLIVVAIIAILAAIAVPNFLEAQTRAQVSRAQSDLRAVATGLESYHIDHNAYPFDWDSRGWPWYMTDVMTTPITYLSNASLMRDLFRRQHDVGSTGFARVRYRYVNYPANLGPNPWPPSPIPGPFTTRWTMQGGVSQAVYAQATERFGLWKLSSAGPDGTASGSFFTGAGEIWYDPTNGTGSAGDIIRSQKGSYGGGQN